MREIKFRAFINNKIVDNSYALDLLKHGNYFEYPVMQYTGLKDKNGVEIYEGDIIKKIDGYTNWKDYFDLIGEVIFKNGCFMFADDYPRGIEEDFEVIGNIYENKELLNT